MTDDERISKKVTDTLVKHESDLADKTSIVSDFTTVLDSIGESGLPVSGRINQFKARDLIKMNSQLKMPLKVNIARPTYHSYPNIFGLYGLLKHSGCGSFKMKDGKNHIILDQDRTLLWKNRTETEKYLSLFMTWIKGSTGKTEKCLSSKPVSELWVTLFMNIGEGEYKIKRDSTRENAMLRNPGMDILSLMGMFGLLDIHQDEPELVETWIPVSIAKTQLGEELMAAVCRD